MTVGVRTRARRWLGEQSQTKAVPACVLGRVQRYACADGWGWEVNPLVDWEQTLTDFYMHFWSTLATQCLQCGLQALHANSAEREQAR